MGTKVLTASYVLDPAGVKKGVDQAQQHLGGLTTGLQKVGKVDVFGPLRGAATQMGGSFGPVTEGLSMMQSGLAGIGAQFKAIGDGAGANMKKVGTALAGAGGVAAGLGAGSMMIGAPIKQAHDQLKVAVADSGHDLSDYQKRIDDAKGHLVKFASGTEVENSLARLTTVMNDPKKALDSLNEVSDIAASKHISLAAATEMVAKAYANPTRLAKQFGIDVTKSAAMAKTAAADVKTHEAALAGLAKAQQSLSDLEARQAGKKPSVAGAQALAHAQEAVVVAQGKVTTSTTALDRAQTAAKVTGSDYDRVMAQIGTKTHGQMAASTNNLKGTLNGLKNTVEESVGTFGNKFGPALTGAGAGVSLLGGGLGLVGKGMEKFGKAGKAAAAAADKVKDAQKAAALASEALSAAKGIETGVTEGETVATVGLAGAEGLALAPILLIVAAIGLVIGIGYLLITHWKDVARIAGEVWGAISRAATVAFDAVGKAISTAVGFVTRLPGQILAAVAHAGEWLLNAGKDIVTGLINGILHMGEAARKAVTDLAGNMVKGALGIFGIHSPSSVFAGMGRNMMAGLGQGITDGAGHAHAALANVSKGLSVGVALTPGGAGAVQPIVLNQSINLDGREIGRSTYTYLLDRSVTNGAPLFPT
jgi:hypothetical protein